MKKILTKIILLTLLSCFSSLLVARDAVEEAYGINTDWEYDDSQDKPWVEDKIEDLPVANNDELVELDIDHPPIGFKVFIDTSSIAVSESDRVVRYWLVLTSGKSRNAMYEGIKCNSSEYKTFAFENKWKKGKVNINPVAKWLPIRGQGHDAYRHELERYYFCSGPLSRPLQDILDIIAGYKSTTSDFDPTYHHAQ